MEKLAFNFLRIYFERPLHFIYVGMKYVCFTLTENYQWDLAVIDIFTEALQPCLEGGGVEGSGRCGGVKKGWGEGS